MTWGDEAMTSSSSLSDDSSVASDLSEDSWHRIRSTQGDAECQTDHLPCMMTLADIIEEDRLSWPRAQAAAVAAPAQAAAQSSAQPPAQRPQAGNNIGYFRILGDDCGIRGTVDGSIRGSSKCGKRFRRSIPRYVPGADVHEHTRQALLAHAQYWVDVLLDARNLSNKLRYADDKTEIQPRLREHIPPSHVLEVGS